MKPGNGYLEGIKYDCDEEGEYVQESEETVSAVMEQFITDRLSLAAQGTVSEIAALLCQSALGT